MSCRDCSQCAHGAQPESRTFTIALAGNPNVGKSTIFNGLTGLHQHTGNWAGKTVAHARGTYRHQGHTFQLADLPGTYSLLANSPDEEVTRDFICFEKPDVTVVVTDGTCLERNLNLALQVMEVTPRTVLVVNLMDEARRKGLHIDLPKLQRELGIPVVGAAAREGFGLAAIKDAVCGVATGTIQTAPKPFGYPKEIEEALARLVPLIEEATGHGWNTRWLALRLLDGDLELFDRFTAQHSKVPSTIPREVSLCHSITN